MEKTRRRSISIFHPSDSCESLRYKSWVTTFNRPRGRIRIIVVFGNRLSARQQNMRFYHFSSVELVRIGTGRALIKEITRQQVSYTDEAGRAMHVDLEECARIYHCLQETGQFPPGDDTDWTRLADTFPNFSAIDVSFARCVGLRAVLDEPPWFQFLNRRRTQFEFPDYEHIQTELRVPLGHVGWSSWDAS